MSKTSALFVSNPATKVLRGFHREAVDEDRQPAQHSALRFGQQVVAPVDRRSQGLVTGHLGSVAGTEHPEAVMKASRDLFERQDTDPRGGQFDRQRYAVETTADLNGALTVAGREDERRQRSLGSLGQKPDGLVLERPVWRQSVLRLRKRKRRNKPDSFAIDAQRLAACREDSRPRSGLQEILKKAGACANHVLAVVNDQESLSRREKAYECLAQALTRLLPDAKGTGDGLRHERLVTERRQIDPPDAIFELLFHGTGHLEGQARFTGAAGTNEREQARRLERVRDLGDFTLAADEAREPGWQIRLGNLADEAVAQAMGGFDEVRRVGIVPEGIADFADAHLQHGIRHGRVWPDGCKQLVLRHKAPRACDEIVQHRERLRSKRNDRHATMETTVRPVQSKRTERDLRRILGPHASCLNRN